MIGCRPSDNNKFGLMHFELSHCGRWEWQNGGVGNISLLSTLAHRTMRSLQSKLLTIKSSQLLQIWWIFFEETRYIFEIWNICITEWLILLSCQTVSKNVGKNARILLFQVEGFECLEFLFVDVWECTFSLSKQLLRAPTIKMDFSFCFWQWPKDREKGSRKHKGG